MLYPLIYSTLLVASEYAYDDASDEAYDDMTKQRDEMDEETSVIQTILMICIVIAFVLACVHLLCKRCNTHNSRHDRHAPLLERSEQHAEAQRQIIYLANPGNRGSPWNVPHPGYAFPNAYPDAYPRAYPNAYPGAPQPPHPPYAPHPEYVYPNYYLSAYPYAA